MSETSQKPAAPKMTKKEVKAYLAEIEKKVIDREGADMASLVAINNLLNQPNAEQLFDDELRKQVKDLWVKLKSGGIQVDDPPLLFGLPEGFGEEEIEQEEVLGVHYVSSSTTDSKSEPKETEPEAEPEAEAEAEEEEEEEPLPH